MIDVKDLRVGNYIATYENTIDGNKIISINSMDNGGSVYIETGVRKKGCKKLYSEQIYPIDIDYTTILRKCGFRECKNGMFELDINIAGKKYTLVCDPYTFAMRLFLKIDSSDEIILFEIDYLHELQNLVFSLTGEELEVKL